MQTTVPGSDPSRADTPVDVTYRLHFSRKALAGNEDRPVFVLVHGIGMSHRYFARLQAELIPHGETIVFDLPGFGGTPTPARQLSVADYAHVIADALKAAGIQSCIVVGHSMGAQFVTELAVQHPDLVSAVVLIGPVTDTAHPSAVRNAVTLALDTMLERPVTNLLVGAAYLRCGFRWYMTELPVMLSYRLDDRLEATSQPVLVLRGSLDPIATRSWCRRLAGKAPRGRTVDIPGQPHAAHRTGAHAVTTAILDLMDQALPLLTSADTEEVVHPTKELSPQPTSMRSVQVPVTTERRPSAPDVVAMGRRRQRQSVTMGDRLCRAYFLEHQNRNHRPAGTPRTDRNPVFVLIHGIGMSHRYFLRLGHELSGYGTVLLIDLPGYGWTRRPAHGMSNPGGAEILAALLDDIGVSACTVVGHSMGTQTATELAIQRPDLVSELVLIGAAVDARRRTVPEQALALGLNSVLEKPLLNAAQFLDVLRCGPRWYLAELAVAMAYPLEERLPGVTHPVLVMRGSRDLVAGTRWSSTLATTSQNGSLTVIPGAPHSVHHRSPAVVAEHIITFVAHTHTRPLAPATAI